MISFRFHVVSIAAAFLAMAIGVVVGSTYVDRAIVDGLENRIDTVSGNLDQLLQHNEDLEAEIGRLDEYARSSADFAVTGRLTDGTVLVLAARGVDPAAPEQIAALAGRAGATVPGVVWIEPRWSLSSESDLLTLIEALDMPSRSTPEQIWRRAWNAMFQELAAAPIPVEETEGTTTTAAGATATTEAPVVPPPSATLAALEEAGFLTVEPVADGSVPLTELAGSSPHVAVVVGSAVREDLLDALPVVVQAPVDAGLPTVIADVHVEEEDGPSRGMVLDGQVPDDLWEAVVLVDNADVIQGRVAAVLSLERAADGAAGHFGSGPGAAGPLPGWSPP